MILLSCNQKLNLPLAGALRLVITFLLFALCN